MERIVISISGKGGTGKTTLAALLLKILTENNDRDILVVDADPASNVPDTIGISVKKTVGTVATELKKRVQADELPPGIPKSDILESWVMEILHETPKFDLLVMGRGEGEGCYCMVNNLLTRILDMLSKNYDVTLMDMEPGLEHLSRRTDRDVDIMLIVTDPSKMGFMTAKRIKDLTGEVHIDVGRTYLVGNRFPLTLEKRVEGQSRLIGADFGGVIPEDPSVLSYNLEGKSLLELPSSSPAFRAVREIAKRIGLS